MAPRAGIDHDLVIRAARDIIESSGAQALTLTRLASVLGVRTPSLYNHVDGMGGLRRDIALAGNRELAQTLAASAMGRTRDDAVSALTAAYRRFVHEHPGLYNLMVQTAPAGRAPDPDLDRTEADVVQVVLAALSGYGLAGAAGLHAARALRSLVHGFASLEAAGAFGLPLDVDESFELLVQLYIGGLQHQARAVHAGSMR